MTDAPTSIGDRAQLALVGFRYDENSSYMKGASEAPPQIRAALRSEAWNLTSENGTELESVFFDAGDVETPASGEMFSLIENSMITLLNDGLTPIALGGDHSITYPILKAFARRYPKLTIVHFDAHPDLYDEFEGSRVSHACPFTRIMEEKLAQRLVQIGIRTLNRHQREQAEKFGVEMVQMAALPAFDPVKIRGPVYISFDMDVLDPAFAPGVSHREPGGMTVREAIAHLHAVEGTIVGADIVEYNPEQDLAGITGTVAAKILKEIVGKMMVG